jgi:hypothetical protein
VRVLRDWVKILWVRKNMKLSTTNFDELRKLNEEYIRLSRKNFNGNFSKDSLWNTCLALFLACLIGGSTLFIGVIFSNKTNGFWGCLAAIIFLIVICNLLDLLSKPYEKTYQYFSHKTPSYNRYRELEIYLPTIKPKLRKQVSDYCTSDLTYLIEQIRATLQNKPIYENLIITLRENDTFIRQVFSYDIELKMFFANKYENILKKNDIWSDYQIEEKEREERKRLEEKEGKKRTIQNSLEILKIKKITSNNYNPIGLGSTPNTKNEPIEKKQEKPIETSDQIKRNPTTKENIVETKSKATIANVTKPTTTNVPEPSIADVSKPTIANIPKQQELVFEPETGNLIKTDILPARRERLSSPKLIKASAEFWKNLQNKRMEIGKLGELLVMEYERERIMEDEGIEFLYHLQHSSVTEADGLGYDLTSCFERERVFIEVKMTKGKFDADLFFTKNEIDTMKKIGKKYFLYRVYDFDKKTKEGKLQVFKGRKEIESFFDFTPQTFTLQRKK